MRFSQCHFERGPGAQERSERGFATFILIALLAIMLMLVTAESSALFHLHREVQFLERQQIKRLNLSQTNAPSAVPVTKTPDRNDQR